MDMDYLSTGIEKETIKHFIRFKEGDVGLYF